jgi:sporulation protein YlmC with PRC-barrel domain
MLKSILLSAVLTTGVAAAALAQTSTSPSTPSTSPSTTAPATTAPSTAPATTLPTTRPSAAAPSTTVTTTTAAAPNAMKGSTLMDLKVKNNANETIGEIDDVIVSSDGKVEQVIVSVGGFLGIGERKVAIAWQDVKFDANREVAMVNMTKDQLKTAPEFKDRRAAVRTDRPATDRPLTGAVPATPPAPATPADKPKTSP